MLISLKNDYTLIIWHETWLYESHYQYKMYNRDTQLNYRNIDCFWTGFLINPPVYYWIGQIVSPQTYAIGWASVAMWFWLGCTNKQHNVVIAPESFWEFFPQNWAAFTLLPWLVLLVRGFPRDLDFYLSEQDFYPQGHDFYWVSPRNVNPSVFKVG